jgi:hypothetical protein
MVRSMHGPAQRRRPEHPRPTRPRLARHPLQTTHGQRPAANPQQLPFGHHSDPSHQCGVSPTTTGVHRVPTSPHRHPTPPPNTHKLHQHPRCLRHRNNNGPLPVPTLSKQRRPPPPRHTPPRLLVQQPQHNQHDPRGILSLLVPPHNLAVLLLPWRSNNPVRPMAQRPRIWTKPTTTTPLHGEPTIPPACSHSIANTRE